MHDTATYALQVHIVLNPLAVCAIGLVRSTPLHTTRVSGQSPAVCLYLV